MTSCPARKPRGERFTTVAGPALALESEDPKLHQVSFQKNEPQQTMQLPIGPENQTMLAP
jgi:hypothetical protein